MTRRLRSVVFVALAAYVAFVLFVTLWPTPVDQPVSHELRVVINEAHKAGSPPKIGYGFIEATANVMLFVPLGILVVLLLARSKWWYSLIFGCVLSLLIEGTQFVALPDRTASFVDVACNTGGVLIGALIVVGVRSLRSTLRNSRWNSIALHE
jgi:glycopeptide antibiotics resistance protein